MKMTMDDLGPDFQEMDLRPSAHLKKPGISLCVGCGSQIQDQYIMRVSPDLEWHASCLKCVDCQCFLDESCTCFVRDGKTYCKRDYNRLFGIKCAKCTMGFSKTDLVMRTKFNKIYHLECFRCIACSRKLVTGEKFALREDGLFCEEDHLEKSQNDEFQNNNNNTSSNKSSIHGDSLTGRSGSNGGSRSHKSSGGDHKPTRVRTVLNEKQLQTLRQCYNANPRPDALMREQLVEMTNLSPRVIRVWFQNKRCKDKKRSILIKHQMEQQQKQSINGVPMVASSPVRHDSSLQANPVEVQSYQPPWGSGLDGFMPGLIPSCKDLQNEYSMLFDHHPHPSSMSDMSSPMDSLSSSPSNGFMGLNDSVSPLDNLT